MKIELSQLEQFILHPKERKNVISKYSKDSEEYFFLSIYDILGSDLSDKEKENQLKALRELNLKRTTAFENIEKTFLALDLCNIKNLSNSSEIIQKVKNIYGPHLSHGRVNTGSAKQTSTSFSTSLNIKLDVLNSSDVDFSRAQVQYDAFEKDNKSLIAKIIDSGRIVSPDHPSLVKAIVDHYKKKKITEIPVSILNCLTTEQLDELRKLMPELINSSNFVNNYIARIIPNPEDDVENDYKAREDHLNVLRKFASKLSVAFTDLKLNIVYSLLKSKLDRDELDDELFLEYIKIPKYDDVTIIPEGKVTLFNFSRSSSLTHKSFYPLNHANSKSFVSQYLIQYFRNKKSHSKSYESYIKSHILESCFAHSKLYYGKESEHEAALKLLPSYVANQLRESVEIEFHPSNKKFFYPEDTISLTLEIKNVKKLLVKVFEINTHRYYRDNKKEIKADITLDGLVPNKEEIFTFECSPFTKTRKTFDFPYLKNRGVYAIEFIGGEKALRALVRKGKLSFVEKFTANGHMFTIVDENHNKYTKASIWMDGHRYHVNDDGNIIIPYTNRPCTQQILIINDEDNFTVLERFNHLKEDYQFNASFYVDREQLLSLKKATVLIKPNLYLNSIPVSVEHLENVVLTITTVNLDHIDTQKEVKNISLKDEQDYTYTFQTPDRIISIAFTLTAELKKLTGERINLSDSQTFHVNSIDQQLQYKSTFLKKTSEGYFIYVLGKSGEPIPNEVVSVQLKHQALTRNRTETLQTDNTGKINLGHLDGFESITYNGKYKALNESSRTPLTVIHGNSTDSLSIPFDSSSLERRNVSLFRTHESYLLEDLFNHLSLEDGYLHIKPLPPGDYSLLFKDKDSKITIKIIKGIEHSDWIFGDKKLLERSNNERLQAKIEKKENSIVCTITNYSENTRVHVIGSDFLPDFDLSSIGIKLRLINPSEGSLSRSSTTYMTRTLGDEYKYVLDRKYLESIPGNTLTRPTLLLNPQALESTKTGHHTINQGYDELARSDYQDSYMKRGGFGGSSGTSNFASGISLDFKSNTSYCLYNLTPNEDGTITISMDDIGQSSFLRVLIIDGQEYLYKEYSLENSEIARRATFLTEKRLLDIDKHYTEQKSIAELRPGESFVINDVSSSQYEIYDTFSSVFNYYLAYTNNPTLKEFSWIQNWTSMTEEEKAEKYNKYGCHELHVLLYFKDRTYFNRVIKPYLQNKLQKTLIDDYLVGNDLSKYLEEHRYHSLNVFEKILIADRIEKERDAILSSISDHADYLPTRESEFNKLFEAGLKGSELDEDSQANKNSYYETMENLPPPPPPSESLSFAPSPAPPPSISTFAMLPQSMPQQQPMAPMRAMVSKGTKLKKKAMAPEKRISLDQKPLYKEIETTKVYAETNYYGRNNKEHAQNLVPINTFWGDYARCSNKDDFVSKNFIFATSSFAEMMFALSVMNLSFGKSKKQAYNVEFEDVTMTIQAESTGVLIFYKEIKESEVKPLPVMVSQMFFDPDNRYTQVKGVQMEKYVDGEFLYGKIYGCDYVITNMSSCQQKAEVLLQIPLGAVPVNSGFYTKSFFVTLSPFSTQRNSFYFYFPYPGKFSQFPAHLGDESYVIGYAQPASFNVVENLTKHDTQSWEYISQVAENEEFFKYLETSNIFTVDLAKIAWRLRDEQVYKKVISILKKRHVYNSTLWAYSILHSDIENILIYMAENPSTPTRFDPYTKLGNITLDPVEYKLIEHLEYWPIVNARAHKLGNETKIMNRQFSEHYQNFLQMLVSKVELTTNDYLELTYYLILQDRYKEAKEVFEKAKNSSEANEYILFRDYIECYLDFFNDNPSIARKISEKYIDYPVQRWNKLFATVRQQLDEIELGTKDLVDVENRDESQNYLASKSESLEFDVKNDQITIHHQNVGQVTISYFKMDIELLFSTSPFVQNDLGFFAYIKPNTVETVVLNHDKHETVVPIPQEFKNLNIMIEISSATLNIVKPHFSHSLFVSIVEKYGQLRVCDRNTGKPIPKSYIKVYARHTNGTTKFYKDGYTDLRGGFDYTSLNTPDLDTTERFSILVMSPNNGTRIVEASKPKR